MILIAKIVILIGLIKILDYSNKPVLCAVIYTIISAILSFVFSTNIALENLLISLGISFVLAFIYFWLLQKTEGSFIWWIILIGGFFIGII